jgi:hypothetical protein
VKTSTERWQELLLELFTDEMSSRWGWGKTLSPARGTKEVPAVDRALVDAGGLDIPYFCGWVTVNFKQSYVKCHAVDQKTPADEYWTLSPEKDWWKRARSCDWPCLVA